MVHDHGETRSKRNWIRGEWSQPTPVTYSEYLTLGELSILHEQTKLGHVLVEPLCELIAGQRGTVLALERFSQGRNDVCGFIGGLSFYLRLGGGHGEEGAMRRVDGMGCGR